MNQAAVFDHYAQARESMVVSQLHPSGIVDENVLNAYRAIPREAFVPQDKKSVCYLDDSLKLSKGRVLIEPMIHGTMVENLHLSKMDAVLDIGGFTGYSAAILSQVAGQVTALESVESAAEFAKTIFEALEIYNVDVVTGILNQGVPRENLYDAIVINGAISEIPQSLLDQLKTGGRLACIFRPANKTIGQVVIFRKEASGIISQTRLIDAAAAYLPGFEPKPVFTF